MLVFCLKKRNEKPNICVHVSKCVHPKKETSRHPPHHSHTHHKSREMSDDNTDTQRFSPAEMEQSDGTVRNWDFTVTRTRIYLPYHLLRRSGLLTVVASAGNEHRYEPLTQKRFAQTIDGSYEFKLVAWCPCGRTFPAQHGMTVTLTRLPVVMTRVTVVLEFWRRNTWPKQTMTQRSVPVFVRSFTR